MQSYDAAWFSPGSFEVEHFGADWAPLAGRELLGHIGAGLADSNLFLRQNTKHKKTK